MAAVEGSTFGTRLLLTGVVVAAAAVSLTLGVFLAYDGIDARAQLVRHLELKARLLATSGVAAVSFADAVVARETIKQLHSTGVESAALLVVDQQDRQAPAVMLASLGDMEAVPTRFPDHIETSIGTAFVQTSAPIIYRDQVLGHAVVRESTDVLSARLRRHAIAALLALLLGLGAASLLTRRLRRRLSAQLAVIQEVAIHAAQTQQLGQRARVHRHLGLEPFVNAFNGLLESVEARMARLEQDRANLRGLIGALPDPVYLLDASGQFIGTVSPSGKGREEIKIGLNLADVLPATAAAQCIGAMAEAIERDAPQLAAYEIETDGQPRSYEGRFSPPPTESGAAVVFVERDVTELRRAEEQLRQSEKMRSLGQLTGGIAHDFNNILAVVLGNLELLEDEVDGESHDELLRPAIDAVERGARLTKRLLAFARRQPLAPRPTDPNALIEGMSAMLRRTLGVGVDLEVHLSDAVKATLVDPGQLENALLNLAVNARDAMPEGGKLTIETANCHFDLEGADTTEFVMVAVSDTGHGVPAGVLKRVFDPFFTTKEQGKGTGLGLSMVYGFCKQSGGDAHIHSEVGRGTTVKLYLPQRKLELTAQQTAVPERALPKGHAESILVVEDDPDLLRLARRLLDELGYTVHAADCAAEAIEILLAGTDIQLLFTDVVLPRGRTGVDVAEVAKTTHPQIRILFMSGYTQNALTRDGTLRADVNLIDKPFRKKELAHMVAQTLAGPPAC